VKKISYICEIFNKILIVIQRNQHKSMIRKNTNILVYTYKNNSAILANGMGVSNEGVE